MLSAVEKAAGGHIPADARPSNHPVQQFKPVPPTDRIMTVEEFAQYYQTQQLQDEEAPSAEAKETPQAPLEETEEDTPPTKPQLEREATPEDNDEQSVQLKPAAQAEGGPEEDDETPQLQRQVTPEKEGEDTIQPKPQLQRQAILDEPEEAETLVQAKAQLAPDTYSVAEAQPKAAAEGFSNPAGTAQSLTQASNNQSGIRDAAQQVLEDPVQLAAAQAGLVVFGPVGIGIAVTITGGIVLTVWLNNGGWEQIGEIRDVIGRGISATLDELKQILDSAGQAAVEQFEEIAEYLQNNVFPARRGEGDTSGSREHEQKVFDDAVRRIERIIGRRLSDNERRALHIEISGEGHGFWAIVIIGVEMFGTAEQLENTLDSVPEDEWPEGWAEE